MGVHGDTGTGVGCVCSSSCGGDAGRPLAPGSRNEKKLCDIECLWWCPRRDVADIGVCPPVISSPSTPGGRAPNVNPAPRGVGGAF